MKSMETRSEKANVLKYVLRSQLCVSCGTCVGVCPVKAIEMMRDPTEHNYLPIIDDNLCINCGLCGDACPGHIVDFNMLNNEFIEKKGIITDPLMGKFLKCYHGHSLDKDIRFNSTSGGIITHLLMYALENELIDGAIVIRMRQDKPLETEAILARTKEELIESTRSKYCPASPNVILNEILKNDGKYAVVGLPCHIHGIRKAELLNDKLRERIVLHIGLMCSHTVKYSGTELILEKLGISKDHVTDISYRGYGWPGGMNITTIDQKNTFIPLFGKWRAYWPVFSSFFFTPLRCIMCPDQTAELADLSTGDAWLPEMSKDEIGESILIVRTSHMDEILQNMNRDKAIEVKEIDYNKVKQSQKLNLVFKKKDINTRLKMLSKLGCRVPEFNGINKTDFSVLHIMRGMYAYVNLTLSSNKIVRTILFYLPFPFFRVYFGIYKILSLL